MNYRRFRKSVLAAVLVVVLIPSGVALAVHPFTDVPGERFFSEPVQWAWDNGLTTGTSPSTFEPDRAVTRGENITFAYRYDKEIVQPELDEVDAALDDVYTKAEVDAALEDVYTKAEVDATFDDVYTKAEVDAALAGSVVVPGGVRFYSVHEVTTRTSTENDWSIFAYCESGDTVTGGGFESLGFTRQAAAVYRSGPTIDNDGWEIYVDEVGHLAAGEVYTFVVFAQCVEVVPPAMASHPLAP